ncbi:hypothetical protein [Anaerolentibacter hominis]|uniref:hypothetical protein n=1 Tax=Anaerolentibacter hominis TaxID=3079009 RepID=UPI0031B851F4
MNREELIRSLKGVGPDPAQRERMLSGILDRVKEEPGRVRRYHRGALLWKAAVSMAAIILILLLIPQRQPRISLVPEPAVAQEQQSRAFLAVRMEESKYFNYNGLRYEFLSDGAEYDLSQVKLKENLGTLVSSDSVTSGNNGADAGADFTANYAEGGEIYRLSVYKEAFRLGVVWEERCYLAQAVSYADGSLLPAKELFEPAQLGRKTERLELTDMSNGECLASITSGRLLGKLAGLLEESQEEQPGEVGMSDDMIQLRFFLNDGTQMELTVLSRQKILMGGGSYQISDECSALLDSWIEN